MMTLNSWVTKFHAVYSSIGMENKFCKIDPGSFLCHLNVISGIVKYLHLLNRPNSVEYEFRAVVQLDIYVPGIHDKRFIFSTTLPALIISYSYKEFL